MFNTYAPSVASRLATASPLAVDASYTILDGMLDISVDVAVDAATSGAGRTVRFFVASEDEHGHLNMVRAVLTPEPFTLTTPG